MSLKVWEGRCISMRRLLSSSSLSAYMPNFMRICGPVVFSGLSIAMGHGWMRSRSSSPEMLLLSSSCGRLSSLGGGSCWLVGCALVLVVGAGGGGDLLSSFFSRPTSRRFLVIEFLPVRVFRLCGTFPPSNISLSHPSAFCSQASYLRRIPRRLLSCDISRC